MKQDQIKLGQVYAAKVTGKVVPVRIDAENPNGGWDATNTHTNRPVRIKSVQRLRNKVSVPGADDKPATSATRAKKPAKATKDAKAESKRDTAKRPAKGGKRDADGEKPMSLLDAAAHLLSLGTGDDPGAMRCQDIVDLAVERGLWQPGSGKTPANTLYASILREINTKGEASRFVKAERGKFALASKKGA